MRIPPLALPLPLFLIAPLFVAIATAPACSDDKTTATPAVVEAGADTAVAPVTCGQPGSLCTGTEWCEYSLVGTCGREGRTGACKGRPTTCSNECPAVCGCDGRIYCNPCFAQLAGSDVDKNRTCFPAGGEVTAYSLPGDPARIAIFKKDASRKICLRVTLIRRLGTLFGLDVPADWGVESGEITNDADDCTITTTGLPLTPKGAALRPNGGQGNVRFSSDSGQGGKVPCKVSVAARLAFEPTPDMSWVPNVEILTSDNVNVAGACQ